MNKALIKSLKEHEGCSLDPYPDSLGLLTVGYGHLLQRKITQDEAEALLLSDITTAIKELDRAFPGWRNHSEARQNVLIEMCYQMGAPKLAGFKKMWACLASQDYAGAALEMLASKWASQTPKRAHALAKRMEEDLFQ